MTDQELFDICKAILDNLYKSETRTYCPFTYTPTRYWSSDKYAVVISRVDKDESYEFEIQKETYHALTELALQYKKDELRISEDKFVKELKNSLGMK